eukprot:CAMPEP_0177656310 /NCGR_PEP_ID=MMETSP0447-20121125/15488_1 /TAXON_ID=0 /ORGANISM="Stygamoeba regulata, Strain BSH-02190019" /LENGTH=134 /DNA_ID=CAMNT_0019160399 /DNA_START=56 /DNA_END=460 /DNA_ORIENTATION=+
MSWRARLSRQVQELRFRFCDTAPESAGIRAFLEENYSDLKALNPRLSFLIRDDPGVAPVMYARYDFGEEKAVKLDNRSAEEVERELQRLCELGSTMPRSRESVPKDFDVIQTFDSNPEDPEFFTSVGAVRSGER